MTLKERLNPGNDWSWVLSGSLRNKEEVGIHSEDRPHNIFPISEMCNFIKY